MTQPIDTPTPPPPPRRSGGGFRILLLLTAAAVVLFGIAAGIIWWAVSQAKIGQVDDGSFLHVELSGRIPDAPPQPGIFDDPNTFPPTATEIAASIRKAATDDRIDGLYLELDGAGAGWATWQEIRSAIGDFREAGKPCVAYSPGVIENGSYYLASACDTVAMAEAGVLLVNGLSIEVSYYKGTLEKLGIEPEFEHVGDFKSAIETFERTGPSESAAEAYDGILDSLYDQMVGDIAATRGVDVATVTGWIDRPTLAPPLAKERGMIDVVAFPDAMAAHVHEVADADWLQKLDAPVTDEDEPKLTKLKEYVKEVRRTEGEGADKVAVLHAEGSIVSGDSGGGLFGGSDNLTDGKYAKMMRRVRKDDSIKAVVVRVNSPGGSALASSLMWRENARTIAAGKPVVISMADYAASGGYLISANADWIVAEPGTITGSIGVFAGKFDLSGAYDKIGVGVHAFERGDMANMLSLSSGFDDDERVVFREYIEFFYDVFLGVVSDGREMERDAVHQVAQGRVWTGTQALERGLVDELGTLDDAIAKAAELANISDPGVVRLPKRLTLFEQIVENIEEGQSTASVAVDLDLPFDLDERVRADLATMESIGQTGGVAAWLPGWPTVK